MNKHSSFTVKELNNLPLPEKGSRNTYHDTNVSGLTLRVTSTGKKSFVIRKRIKGKPIMTTLGQYPAMSLSQARTAARESLNIFSSGVNPNDKKIEQRVKSITLQEAMNDYISNRRHALKATTIKDYRAIFNNFLFDWSNKELVSITGSMVAKRHTIIGDRSIYRANATMRLLRAIFNFAISEYEDSNDVPIITHNPVQKIRRNWYRESVRTNVIEPNDLKDWFRAVNSLPSDKANTTHKNASKTVKDYLILLLFTGLRQYIIDLLKTRKETSMGKFIFPGYSPHKALVSPNKQVKKVINDSGVQFLLHDLRRTFATYADSLEIQHNTIKRLMNHKNKDVTSTHYIHQSVETLRKPMNKITNYILEQVK